MDDSDALDDWDLQELQSAIEKVSRSSVASESSMNPGGYKPAEKWIDDLDGLLFWEMLGSGAYGDVFKAYSEVNANTCAVKLLRIPKSSVDNQVSEIRALGLLCHPNIVDLYCASIIQNTVLVMVMPLLYSLEDVLEEIKVEMTDDSPAISEASARQLIKQLLIGLAYMHSKGFIHRDLKVANLLLDTHGVLKIADFGVCHEFDPSENELGKLKSPCGTEIYMAPEIYFKFYPTSAFQKHRTYDLRCDSWAVGIILLELIAGRVPFDHILHNPQKVHLLNMMVRRFVQSPVFEWDLLYLSGDTKEKHLFSEGAQDFLKHCLEVCIESRWTSKQLLEHEWIKVDDPRGAKLLRQELMKKAFLESVENMDKYGNSEYMGEYESISAEIRSEKVLVTVMVRPESYSFIRRSIRFAVDLTGKTVKYSKRMVEKLARGKCLPLTRKKLINGQDFVRLTMKIVKACERFRREERPKFVYETFPLAHHKRAANTNTLEGMCLILVNRNLRKSEDIIKSPVPGLELRPERFSKADLKLIKKGGYNPKNGQIPEEETQTTEEKTLPTQSTLASTATEVSTVSAISPTASGMVQQKDGLFRVLFRAPLNAMKKKNVKFNHSNERK